MVKNMDVDVLNSVLWSDTIPQPVSTKVTDHGSYWCFSTPNFDDYWMGNYLFLKTPPTLGSLSGWQELSYAAFSNRPLLHKLVLVWCTQDTWSHEACGFEIDYSVMLSAEAPKLFPPPAQVEIVPVSKENWAKVVHLALSEIDPKDFRHLAYTRRRFEAYAQTIACGRGTWWTAVCEGEVIGSSGFFSDGRIGRFQEVTTARSWRRRGIATALVSHIAVNFKSTHPLTKILIAAEPNSQAERIYQHIGFNSFALQYTAISDWVFPGD